MGRSRQGGVEALPYFRRVIGYPVFAVKGSARCAFMDKALTLQRLAETERHVRRGQLHLTWQTNILSGLEQDGHDITQAKALLLFFEEIQAEHISHRNRLLKEMGR